MSSSSNTYGKENFALCLFCEVQNRTFRSNKHISRKKKKKKRTLILFGSPRPSKPWQGAATSQKPPIGPAQPSVCLLLVWTRPKLGPGYLQRVFFYIVGLQPSWIFFFDLCHPTQLLCRAGDTPKPQGHHHLPCSSRQKWLLRVKHPRTWAWKFKRNACWSSLA